jgi:hypothetical protein
MIIQNSSVAFNSFEGSGPRSESQNIEFGVPLTQAAAILTGFNAAYSPSDGDHHLGNLEIRLDAQIDPGATGRVVVEVTFGLRDWSNEWDDRYEGVVNFAVVAE